MFSGKGEEMSLGEMEMPEDFAYREVFLKGRPVHTGMDAFAVKHPPMASGRRAKIFAPFDALRGFDFEIMTAEAEAEAD